jgi:hypothetical protein
MRTLIVILLFCSFLVCSCKESADSPSVSKRYLDFDAVEEEMKKIDSQYRTAEMRIYDHFLSERERIFEIAESKLYRAEDVALIRKMAWVILLETRRRRTFEIEVKNVDAEIESFPSD